MSNSESLALKRTSDAFIWTRILNTPFWALFGILPFIIYKDLHASAFQVTLMITLKPLVSIFSAYWGSAINKRRDRLLSNVIWANVIKHLPFLFFPFFDNAWFLIFSSGVYMMLHRGVVPAWMEILKINLPSASREKVFANGTAIGYLGDGILPFVLGFLLDGYFEAWRWIFPIAALVSFFGVYFQAQIPIALDCLQKEPEAFVLKKQLLLPWRNAWELLTTRLDFLKFQIGFMVLGGGGLMIMQPALPGFFVDTLKLSYTEMSIALTLCKGIGCAVTSSTWAKLMQKVDLYKMSSWVTALGCLFTLFLLASQFNLLWLYLAYISYGVMQAGSELSWNLSGPIFAKDEDSSIYSGVNVLMVGIRGAIVPAIGSFLCVMTSPSMIILLGSALCLLATIKLARDSKSALSVSLGKKKQDRKDQAGYAG